MRINIDQSLPLVLLVSVVVDIVESDVLSCCSVYLRSSPMVRLHIAFDRMHGLETDLVDLTMMCGI